MDLEKWTKRETNKAIDYVDKATKKLMKENIIDILKDFIPEFKDLSAKSYSTCYAGGSLEACEGQPKYNLGFLMGSGLYENVLVPLRVLPDKTTFEIHYGLSENRGSHLNFEQFVNLIKEGKLKITLESAPRSYKARFYEEIFKSCDEVPPFPIFRIDLFLLRLKLAQMAASEEIAPSEFSTTKMLKLYPRYSLDGCTEEVTHIFGEYLDSYASLGYSPSEETGRKRLSTQLWNLRLLGFGGIAEVALKSARLDKHFGDAVMNNFYQYLVWPLTEGLLAFTNYALHDIQNMSFLKLLPKKLEIIWKDVLSSSPAASSVASCQIGLDTVELKGMELLKLIENLSDDDNAKSLRKNVVDVNKSLGEFDIPDAERSFNKVDEIITESINSEIKGYARKGHVTNHLVRLGKTFTAMASAGLTMLSGLMAGGGKFDWATAAIAGTGASAWVYERLDEIKAEDVVRWWSETWPFDDPGIGFLMWEKATKKKSDS